MGRQPRRRNQSPDVEAAVRPLRAEIRRLKVAISEAHKVTTKALELTMEAQRMTTEAQAYAARLEAQFDDYVRPQRTPVRRKNNGDGDGRS